MAGKLITEADVEARTPPVFLYVDSVEPDPDDYDEGDVVIVVLLDQPA